MSSGVCLLLSISQLFVLWNRFIPKLTITTWRAQQSGLMKGGGGGGGGFFPRGSHKGKLVKKFYTGFVLIGTLRPRALFWVSYLITGTLVYPPHTHSQLCPLVLVQLMGFHDDFTRQDPLSVSVFVSHSLFLLSTHQAPPKPYQTLTQDTNWSC